MSLRAEEPLEAVVFEIPDLASAARLSRNLGKRWEISLQERGDVNLVFAVLRSDPEDLAALLRTVEAWIGAESLCAIRFAVDDRDYVLKAGQPDWSALPARAA
jgi:hypothetical protein